MTLQDTAIPSPMDQRLVFVEIMAQNDYFKIPTCTHLTRALYTLVQLPAAQLENWGAQIPNPPPLPQTPADSGCRRQSALSLHLSRAGNPLYRREQCSLYDSSCPCQCLQFIQRQSPRQGQPLFWAPLWLWVSRPQGTRMSERAPQKILFRCNKALGVCER